MSEPTREEATVRKDWTEGDTVTSSVVSAIAALTGTPPTGVRPLYETVDPDALDSVLESGSDAAARRPALTVSFRHEGCDVTVRADGRLTVKRRANGR